MAFRGQEMGENLSTTEIQTAALSRFLILFKIIILPNEIEYVNTYKRKLNFKTIKIHFREVFVWNSL